MSAYTTSLEHILAELARLEVLLRVQVWRMRQRDPGSEEGGLSTFYIPEAEIDELLDRGIGAFSGATIAVPPEMLEVVRGKLDLMSADIARCVTESLRQGVYLRLVALAHLFELSPFDLDVILLCLALELDRRYQRLYAYLQDDVSRRRPTVDLVLDLLCPNLEARAAARARFTATAPLLQAQIVQLGEEAGHPSPFLLGKTLHLDERVARFLLDDDELDERLLTFARIAHHDAGFDELVLPPEFKARLAGLAAHAANGGDHLIVYCQGPYGVGKRTAAGACCQALGASLIVVNGRRLAASPAAEFAMLLRLIDREARLQGALLYWDGFDALLADDMQAHLALLLSTLEASPGPSLLAGETTWQPVDALREAEFIRLEFPRPGYEERLRLWAAALAQESTDPVDTQLDLRSLASKFQLTGGQIRDATASARGLARLRAPAAPGLTQDDLHTACRLQSSPKLASLAQKITPRYTWSDIVLPADQIDQLHEIYGQVKHRALVHEGWGFGEKLAMGKGLSVLFTGAPGTGKTMAADVLANALDLDLYRIDLATVMSKYIGETEKNLARIFDEATNSSAILFFDEADALFGKRTEIRDAHDRYANVEISYLLQRLEEYEGIVILATNLRKNIDEAFVRRLNFTVEFPLPGVADRRRIWEQIWPRGAPRHPDLDVEFLAQHLEVAGGNIRNIALAGAFLAAADGGVVTMNHLIHATRREYQKMGKVLIPTEFGSYAPVASAQA